MVRIDFYLYRQRRIYNKRSLRYKLHGKMPAQFESINSPVVGNGVPYSVDSDIVITGISGNCRLRTVAI